MTAIRLLLLVCAIFIFSLPAQAAQGERLLKIVALSRHGVRAPTQDAKVLSMWSQKTWPTWPVKKGELTPRGSRLITAMWQNLRVKIQEYGLIPADACPPPGSIHVRADVDERTKATARALLDGLAPDCHLGFAVMPGKVDPLFHPVKAGLYRFNPIPAVTDVLSMTHGGLDNLQEDYAGALALMGKISGPPDPALCLKFTGLANCQIADLPNAISVSPDGHDIRLVGALSVASSMAEIFLLEYGEWPGVPAGWGQIDATTLSQLLPIHSRIFDVVNRAPVVAWAKGSSLLRDMASALVGRHYDDKVVVYVGHDTNLANIGSLLGINWQAHGYPYNGIPPGGVLFLELWEINGKKQIMARFYAQPPQALHAPFGEKGENDILDHAPRAAVVSSQPVVGQARFEVEEFMRKVDDATAGAPLAPAEAPALDFNPVIPK